MAAKKPSPKKDSKPAVAAKAEVARVSTPVRRTTVPKKTPVKKIVPELSHGLIVERAYYISISGTGGSESDNYFRAERELKSELGI